MKIPIMALSQLSRSVENREDKSPQLHDLRESGAIEQDADIVIFLSRNSQKNQKIIMIQKWIIWIYLNKSLCCKKP
ncbi:DnaB-like helicase C-terminal domain-containing protein [Mycoplasmopsis felis]|uniref:DnaB-like helicase C-terminal domain-containing protein n=1 Tax=Mycoplasmopsis felis TaxID=33923 RepID=UPI0021E07C60|nr:DnaB-like helicase C-terminal domain-containing protein [Mycoplasmopsis felis]MCU9938936.1 DnaB-like helicase C-terminal domain-containing protein [Mycoplasmopsis felis]